MSHINSWTLQCQNADLPFIAVGDSWDVVWHFAPGVPAPGDTSDWNIATAPQATWVSGLGNVFSTDLLSSLSGDTHGWLFRYQIIVNGIEFPQLMKEDPPGGSFATYITPTVPDPGFGQFSAIPYQACNPATTWTVSVRITNIGTVDYPGNWFSMSWQIGVGTTCPPTPSITNGGKPIITTTASLDGSGKIQDSAVISGGTISPAIAGTLTFDLYKDDCSGSPVHSESVSVSGNGTYSTTTGYDPAGVAGTYIWVVSFNSTDTWNLDNETACDDVDEQVVIGSISVRPKKFAVVIS